jgi:hypothetical protein
MFRHRHLVRIAVDGSRRRKDEAVDAALHRGIQEAAGRHGVVAVIAERIAHRIRHHDGAGEMNDALDAVLGDHACDEVFIAGVADEQRHAFRQEGGESGGQIVDHDDAFAGLRQRMNHVTSDIAGATGDEHGRGPPLAFEFGAHRPKKPVSIFTGRALLKAMLAGAR